MTVLWGSYCNQQQSLDQKQEMRRTLSGPHPRYHTGVCSKLPVSVLSKNRGNAHTHLTKRKMVDSKISCMVEPINQDRPRMNVPAEVTSVVSLAVCRYHGQHASSSDDFTLVDEESCLLTTMAAMIKTTMTNTMTMKIESRRRTAPPTSEMDASRLSFSRWICKQAISISSLVASPLSSRSKIPKAV